MAWWPAGEMTHRFLMAPRNAERLLAGENAWLAHGRQAAAQAIARRLPGRPKAANG